MKTIRNTLASLALALSAFLPIGAAAQSLTDYAE